MSNCVSLNRIFNGNQALESIDLSNLDVNKIFNEVPKNLYYIDRCKKEDWEKVFKGEF